MLVEKLVHALLLYRSCLLESACTATLLAAYPCTLGGSFQKSVK